MKLTYEDKLEIYKLRKQGVSWSQICNQFDVNVSELKYMVRLMD
ncbi:transposase [Streptococcus sp. SQ9-PEA]|uniref:Transposase n=1 Tax=Streptococcus sciuri TaxID=2973939 RepID=A0ABT2F7V6_9STRE|nr:transposase [Streptococcus sciuri]MCS4488581.1 transposase [Streptococcus sciuri]